MAFPERNYQLMAFRGEERTTWFLEKMPGSPTYSFAHNDGRSASEYYVKWDGDNINIPQARMDFLGYSEEVTVAQKLDNKIYVSRIIPYEHPNFPDDLFADSIQKIIGDIPARYGPSRDVNEVAEYDEMLATVNFSERPYEILTDQELMGAGGTLWPDESKLLRYVNVEIVPSGRNERIPSGAALKWTGQPGNGSAAANNTGVFPIIEATVSITWYQIPARMVPWVAIDACLGKTNRLSLGTSGSTIYTFFNAETLVCLNPKIGKLYRMANGLFACDVQYNFLWKPRGANYFFRWDADGGPGYQLVTRNGLIGGAKLFQTADFDRLFWGPNQPAV